MIYLFVVLLILKLVSVIHWSWWIVTLPLWVGIALWVGLTTIGAVLVVGVVMLCTGFLAIGDSALYLTRKVSGWFKKKS